MTQPKKAVYFFCVHSVDHVAGHVFEAARKLHGPGETDILVDRDPVLRYTDEKGDSFWFVRTERVVSHDFTHYLPIMQRIFRTAPLGLQDLGLTALAAFVIVPVITVEKWVRSRLGARRG